MSRRCELELASSDHHCEQWSVVIHRLVVGRHIHTRLSLLFLHQTSMYLRQNIRTSRICSFKPCATVRSQPTSSTHRHQANTLPSQPRQTTPRLDQLRHQQRTNLTSSHQQSARMSTSNQHLLIRFFDPTIAAPDARNRTLAAILAWPDSQLESSHDYIQTVFPLPEESMFSFAPIATKEVRDAFLAQAELRASLRKALERMLSFYGLQFNAATGEESKKTVTRGPNFASASRNWVTRFDHNHLRMTRILRSLRVLGLESEAAALHDFLSTDEKVTSSVSPRSQMYWRRAAERDLHLPPDEEDEDAEGIAWLQEK
jgi:hypothetical protein